MLNKKLRLANGYLVGGSSHYSDTSVFADKIQTLSIFLQEENIDFLCMPIPSKSYFYDADFLPGYEGDGHNIITEFFQFLDARDINNISIDSWYQKNNWKMEDTYFKTDHHWKPEAAFAATKEIMKYLSRFDRVVYEPSSLAEENWEIEEYKNWFLGSSGNPK